MRLSPIVKEGRNALEMLIYLLCEPLKVTSGRGSVMCLVASPPGPMHHGVLGTVDVRSRTDSVVNPLSN